jgi:hypothetical protein
MTMRLNLVKIFLSLVLVGAAAVSSASAGEAAQSGSHSRADGVVLLVSMQQDANKSGCTGLPIHGD